MRNLFFGKKKTLDLVGANEYDAVVYYNLVLGVVTSVSTTGYIFLIGAALFYVVKHMPERGSKRALVVMFLIVLVALGVAAAFWMLGEKVSSATGEVTRVDDFVAGYLAWLDSPVFGNGLADNDAMLGHMSAFRANNVGTSNSPMVVLAQGGVLLFLVYFVSFLGFLTCRNSNYRVAGILLIFLWTITAVWRLPLMALLMAIGLESQDAVSLAED